MTVTLTEMPPSIAALPRDERGYPVPWFVTWIDGKPEFRVADGRKFALALKEKRCWVCGEHLDPNQHVFVIGPMCSINRTTAEPPCHVECAEFSVLNCPFLAKPSAVRREANLPGGTKVAGEPIRRNPGVTCLWFCKGYELFNDGRGGVLFEIPGPAKVRWYREGRKATRTEIMESINTGIPILAKMAEQDGEEGLAELRRAIDRGVKFVPAN